MAPFDASTAAPEDQQAPPQFNFDAATAKPEGFSFDASTAKPAPNTPAQLDEGTGQPPPKTSTVASRLAQRGQAWGNTAPQQDVNATRVQLSPEGPDDWIEPYDSSQNLAPMERIAHAAQEGYGQEAFPSVLTPAAQKALEQSRFGAIAPLARLPGTALGVGSAAFAGVQQGLEEAGRAIGQPGLGRDLAGMMEYEMGSPGGHAAPRPREATANPAEKLRVPVQEAPPEPPPASGGPEEAPQPPASPPPAPPAAAPAPMPQSTALDRIRQIGQPRTEPDLSAASEAARPAAEPLDTPALAPEVAQNPAPPPRIRTVDQIMEEDDIGRNAAMKVQTKEIEAVGQPVSAEDVAARKAGVTVASPRQAPTQMSPAEQPGAIGPKGDVKAADEGLFAPKKPGQDVMFGRQPRQFPQTETPEFKRWFGDSKVVDAESKPLVVYHGAQRPDRIDNRFRKARATSGPMAFFTDDPAIASNYATSKSDTSLSHEDADYGAWFRIKPPGARTAVPIDRAWWSLSPEQKAKISALAPRVTRDDDDNIYTAGPEHRTGLGGYDQHIRETRGNPLRALVEEWLNSAALLNDEGKFQQVLKAAGLDMPVEMHDPNATYPAVFPVHLAIRNPLDTSSIPQPVVDALQRASARQRFDPSKGGGDIWDKNRRDPRAWVRELLDDIETQKSSHAWTSIPDWVTKTLRAAGYDGIKDTGGKLGGQEHAVWIPFDDTQVKSATGNRGTFDPNSPRIDFGRSLTDWRLDGKPLTELSRTEERALGPDHGAIMRAMDAAERAGHSESVNAAIKWMDETGQGSRADVLRKYQRRLEAPADAPHVVKAIEDATRITGGHVQIEAHPMDAGVFNITFPDGHQEQVFGYTMGRLIKAAIEPGRTAWNLNHEAVHALKNLGVFDPKEWDTLRATAEREGWHDRYHIGARYADIPMEKQIEEAIAERFADLSTNPAAPGSFLARMVAKLQNFFASLRNSLAGRGFHTAEDIFGKMQRGEVGSREPGSRGPESGPSSITASMKADQEFQGLAFGRRPLGNIPTSEPVKDAEDFRSRLERLPKIGAFAAKASDHITDFGKTVQMMATPMAQGTVEARAAAKDFANASRFARHEGNRLVDWIGKEFTPAEMKEMWERADAESVARQMGADPTGHGLDQLSPRQREVTEKLQAQAHRSLEDAKELGMFKGEGLPSYVPRMVTGLGTEEGPHVVRDIRTLAIATMKLNEAIAGRRLIEAVRQAGSRVGSATVRDGSLPMGRPLNAFGTNLRTTTPQLRQRQHLTTEETEAAARRIPGAMGESGGPPEDNFKWFTIKENPAFWTSRVTGADAEGKPIWEKVPVYVRSDFEGPLRAVMHKPNGAIYKGMMNLKGRMMTSIMYGAAHLGVVVGRALPASPNIIRTMREGNVAKHDPAEMDRAIDAGMVPIGHRFGMNGEISGLEEPPGLNPGRSWTSQILAAIPNLYDKKAGDAVKRSIDKLGDFMHNTLLWDRVGDIQMGLFKGIERDFLKKGVDPESAARAAAHFANRYAGALPPEAMSQGAAKIANTVLFSRTYRLGNLGAIKDMVTGLPRDVQSQILRDKGADALAKVQSVTKRKAIATLALDMALYYVGNSLIQSTANVMMGQDPQDEAAAYLRRLIDEADRLMHNPLYALNPFGVLQSLTPMGDHEPGKQNRILIGYDKDGTGIYLRNPFGKYAEDVTDYWTQPLATLHAMQSPFMRPVSAAWGNDAGFGRKLYDPNPDTPPKVAGVIRDVLLDALQGATPQTAVSAAKKLATGHGGAFEAAQIAGGGLGFAVSHGYPGGPGQGVMAQARTAQEFAQQKAMPGIRDQIRSGDIDGAREAMTKVGIAPALQRFQIMQTLNPHATPRQVQNFMRYATPEQRAQVERLGGGQ